MNKKYIYTIGLIISFFIIFFTILEISKTHNLTNISQSEAILLIKNSYPELKEYPNESFPQKSIRTEKLGNKWYVSFILHGSGVPIINAKCFFVDNKNNVTFIGEYKPTTFDNSNFSLITCKQ
jgi:hypothetical protein